jgi:uncharacterized DUF497 family protein
MNYEWNPNKAVANLDKYHIHFADVVAVFSDEFALTVADDFTDEERFITIGLDAFGQLLVVVYTWRGDETIPIISARKASRHERKHYEDQTR